MTELEILKKQIEALNDLVKIKDQIIEALKAQPAQQAPLQYQINAPSQWPYGISPSNPLPYWIVTCDGVCKNTSETLRTTTGYAASGEINLDLYSKYF